jgi:alcohol dehydrogenase, propanol-preferring
VSGGTGAAIRLHPSAAGGGELRVESQERPEPAPTEVVVEVRACGLGRLDRQLVGGELERRERRPVVVGRELAGVVAAVGSEVLGWQPGDRVAALAVRPCHRCPACAIGRETLCRDRGVTGVDLDGGAATWARVAHDDLVPLPLDLAFEPAAVATDSVAAAYHALKRAGVGDGVTVAVVGVGGHGSHAVQLAKLAGADVAALDLDPGALDHAVALGADLALDAGTDDVVEQLAAVTGGAGVDRVVEAAGTAGAVTLALRCLAPGGRAILLGRDRAPLQGPALDRFVTEELEVAGSFGATPQDLGEVFDLVEAGRLDLSASVGATVGFEAAAAWLRGEGPAADRAGRTVLVPDAGTGAS